MQNTVESTCIKMKAAPVKTPIHIVERLVGSEPCGSFAIFGKMSFRTVGASIGGDASEDSFRTLFGHCGARPSFTFWLSGLCFFSSNVR